MWFVFRWEMLGLVQASGAVATAPLSYCSAAAPETSPSFTPVAFTPSSLVSNPIVTMLPWQRQAPPKAPDSQPEPAEEESEQEGDDDEDDTPPREVRLLSLSISRYTACVSFEKVWVPWGGDRKSVV